MKRIISILLALIMVLAFSACESTDDAGSAKTPGEGGAPTSTPDNEKTSPGKESLDYSITDVVIVDNESCVFTVNKINSDGFWGFTLNVLCENKTDKTLMFSWDKVSVNGYMIDPFWSTEVAAGKKANSEISFYDSDMEKANITSVDEIIFSLRVYDSDDWSAGNLVDGQYSLYPTGLSADAVVYAERTSVTGEQVFVDNEYCTFIIERADPEALWGYTLNCYLENKTDKTLMFSWRDVSLNGFMMDPFWSKEVAPGKRALTDISFSSSDFESNGIAEVSEIEFNLNIYDSNDWTAEAILDKVFVYNP